MNARSVGIVYNPIAGKGSSGSVSERLKLHLEENGFEVRMRESDPHGDSRETCEFVKSVDVLIVAGGDGTLMSFLPVLVMTDTPVYMLPTGNESLFAREFGMSRFPADVVRTLRTGEISRHYVGKINDTYFFEMISLGVDSEVVEMVAHSRGGPIKHKGYFLPALRAFRSHRPPQLILTVDGRRRIDGEEGYLIIANTRQYALGLGFVPEADSTQAELSARFFPYRRSFGWLAWVLRCAVGKALPGSYPPLFRGKRFEVDVIDRESYPVQADGEHIGQSPAVITISDEIINVLRGV